MQILAFPTLRDCIIHEGREAASLKRQRCLGKNPGSDQPRCTGRGPPFCWLSCNRAVPSRPPSAARGQRSGIRHIPRSLVSLPTRDVCALLGPQAPMPAQHSMYQNGFLLLWKAPLGALATASPLAPVLPRSGPHGSLPGHTKSNLLQTPSAGAGQGRKRSDHADSAHTQRPASV